MTSARATHVWVLAIACGLGAAATGCDPFTHVDFAPITDEPAGDRVHFSGIVLTEGRAIGITGTPMEGDSRMDEDTKLVITSNNANVAGIQRSFKKDQFIVYGAAPGHTTFQVTVNDNDDGEIPVEVDPQPTDPRSRSAEEAP
jgi:hypothetical protein